MSRRRDRAGDESNSQEARLETVDVPKPMVSHWTCVNCDGLEIGKMAIYARRGCHVLRLGLLSQQETGANIRKENSRQVKGDLKQPRKGGILTQTIGMREGLRVWYGRTSYWWV